MHRAKDAMGGKGAGWPELVHRIGRAGRFGSKALAINFVSEEDLKAENLANFQQKSVEELTEIVKTQISATPLKQAED